MNALALPHYDFIAPCERFGEITLEEWRALWRNIGQWKRAEQWFYGDLFNAGRRFVQIAPGRAMLDEDWAVEILRLIPHVGIEPKTLINWGHLAALFPPRARVVELSWSHHREVAGLPPAERRKFLQRAAAGQWAVADLREAIAPERADPDASEPAPPEFIPRLFVQQSVRFLAAILPTDHARIAAVRVEFQPVIRELKRLGL